MLRRGFGCGVLKAGVFVLLVAWLSCLGCGKSSALEGRIIDGKDQPIAQLKVIAKQVEPVKGFEQFETVTDADGKFRFEKLYPSSKYTIGVSSELWTTDVGQTIDTAPDGDTLSLPEPLTIRFTTSAAGIVTDSKFDLEWFVGPDNAMSWDEGQAWVTGLTVDGGGWRMPTSTEIAWLYGPNQGTRNMNPALKTTGWQVFAAETQTIDATYTRLGAIYNFQRGERTQINREEKSDLFRAFAVRARKPAAGS